MILTRYVLGEILRTFILAFLGLTAVLFIAFTLGQLHKLSGVGLDFMLALAPSIIPEVVLLTIPAALLLAITFTYGRLAADSELNAMRACGVNLGRILLPSLLFGAALIAPYSWIVNIGVPNANHMQRNLFGKLLKGQANQAGASIRRFQIGSKLFVRYKDFRDGALIEADISMVSKDGERKMIRAREARIMLDSENSRIVFDCSDAMVTFEPGKKKPDLLSDMMVEHLQVEYDVSDTFEQKRRLPDLTGPELEKAISREVKTRYGSKELRTEFHQRRAQSTTPLALSLIAGPLAMLLKRGGRVAGLAAVVLPVFAVHFLLSMLGPRLGENGQLPPWAATWLGPAILAVGGIVAFWGFVRR